MSLFALTHVTNLSLRVRRARSKATLCRSLLIVIFRENLDDRRMAYASPAEFTTLADRD